MLADDASSSSEVSRSGVLRCAAGADCCCAEAISSREAMQMVNEMLDKMNDKYTTSIDS